MTALTPAEQDAYAAPGTTLRLFLDNGVVPWPTREEAAIELGVSDILDRGAGTFAVGEGLVVTLDYTDDEPPTTADPGA